ncbi:hypothetical protein AC578_8476 [Pseudocercospora eumusae]|uniref:Uncharacterized protein n=1 Tax=Pseudocercospora eumusae TaxID=321146 RepID=A0A139HVZ7_9PEZI|nr:hypothetical protein AC578_8476 [Pseudocercospora eumusae]
MHSAYCFGPAMTTAQRRRRKGQHVARQPALHGITRSCLFAQSISYYLYSTTLVYAGAVTGGPSTTNSYLVPDLLNNLLYSPVGQLCVSASIIQHLLCPSTATYSPVHHWPTRPACQPCTYSLAAICRSILTRTSQRPAPFKVKLTNSESVEVFETAQRTSFIRAQHIKHGKARQMRTYFQDDQVRHHIDSMELQHVPLRPSLVHL